MKQIRLNRAVAGLLAASLAAAVMLPGMSVFAEESHKVDLTGGIFTDSGSYAGYEGKAFDGDVNTQWAAKGAGSCWLVAELPALTAFDKVVLYETPGNYYGNRITGMTVQVSDTGEEGTWQTAQTFTGLQNNNRDTEELELNEPAFGQFIKFIVDSDGREININEIELYNLSGAQPPSSNVAAPEANLPSGTYYKDEMQQVILSSQTDGAEIYYTLDGSAPNEESTRFTSPIEISQTTTLRAVAIKDGERSAVQTYSYRILSPQQGDLAFRANCSASSEGDGHPAEFAVDANEDTSWETRPGEGDGSSITLDLGKDQEFQTIRFSESTGLGERISSVLVECSTTGEEGSWTETGRFSWLRNGKAKEALYLDRAVTSRYIRLSFGCGSGETIGLDTIEVYNQADPRTARQRLGDLLESANAVDIRLFKIQYSRDFVTSRLNAKTIYDNDNMMDGQINDAYRILSDALDQLEQGWLGENLALGATAVADDVYDDMPSYNGSQTVDGNFGTRWATTKHGETTEFTLTLDLGAPKEFNQIILYETEVYKGRMLTVSAQVSDDGVHWTDWRMDAEHVPATTSIVAEKVTKQYIKLTLTGDSLNTDEVGVYCDDEAVETEYITDKRPIDPDWIKPVPSTEANVFQQRKAAMKYGMFIHYGVNTFTNREWGTGAEDPSEYNPNVETLDPEQWVRTAWEAGMNYIVLITKHHDGFAMFDTKYSEHKVTNSGHPGGDQDIVKAVADACQKYGIKLGLYYSIWDMNWERNHPQSDYVDIRAWDQAYADFTYGQVEELMTNYGEICELWIDGGWLKETERWEYEHMYDMVKRLQPGCQMSVNLTLGDRPIDTLQGGEEIVNFPSDFKLYDGRDTGVTDPKVFTYKGENYYLPFEGTFIMGNGWFWNDKSSPETVHMSAERMKQLYDKYVAQQNTLVINVPPSNQGLLTPHETARIYEAANLMGIARGNARDNIPQNECTVEVRHVTTTGAIAASTEYLTGQAGEAYSTSPAPNMEQLAYLLTETPENASGTFGEEKIVVEYVYQDAAVPEELDTTELVGLLETARQIGGEEYTEQSYAALQDAIRSAQEALDTATAQFQLDQAVARLQSAIDGLQTLQPANKSILRTVLAYAEAQYADPAFAQVITDVQASFTAALQAARAVDADPAAGQQQVDAAWQALMKEIHKLGFVQGDKTSLLQLIEIARTYQEQIQNYTPVTAEPFTAALEKAQAVFEDGNALQDEVDAASSSLLEGMMNLRLKADKTLLKAVLAQAQAFDLSAYSEEERAVFRSAQQAAEAVLRDSNADQATADKAADDLRAVLEALANKQSLTGSGAPAAGDAAVAGVESSPKTGDTASAATAICLLLAGGTLACRKRRKNG